MGAPFIPRRSPTSREKRDLDVVMGCSGLNSNCALTASPNDSGVAISTLALWMSGKDPRNRPGAPKNLYLTSVWLLYELQCTFSSTLSSLSASEPVKERRMELTIWLAGGASSFCCSSAFSETRVSTVLCSLPIS